MAKKITRRKFMQLGITATASAITLTACGKLFAMGNRVRPVTGSGSSEPGFIIDLAELKQAGAAQFQHNGKDSILIYINGQIRAYENICTHKGGPTAADNGKLVCQWHGATFDPLTGKALTRPAPEGSGLTAIKIIEKNGKLFTAPGI